MRTQFSRAGSGLRPAGFGLFLFAALTLALFGCKGSELPTVVGVNVTPATAMVAPGGTQQFNATVTVRDDPDAALKRTVTWEVDGVAGNTITSSGHLTVAADETAATLTVTARSTDDASKFGTATVTVTSTVDAITVTVSPPSIELAPGGSHEFHAIVTGPNNPAQTVTWTVSGGGTGTSIAANGTLTIASAETATSLTVTATSTADTSKSGTATVTVTDHPAPPATVTSVTVSPSSASVVQGGTQQFSADVTGTNNPVRTVIWAVSGGGTGTAINNAGLLTVASAEAATSLTVTAKSVQDDAKSGTATVTVTPLSTTTAVAFNNLTADGSATTRTTTLILTFDKDITGLVAGDITLGGTTGATRGALTKTGTGVYTLGVSGVTADASISVTVAKTGFAITPSSRNVAVFAALGDKFILGNFSAAGTVTENQTHQGKTGVTQVTPSGWAAMTFDLTPYAGKEITISISADIFLPVAARVAWQANLGTGATPEYPLIAGNSGTNQAAGQWITITGSNKINVQASVTGTLYLSNDGTYGLNGATIYIANFVMLIHDPTSSGNGNGEGGGTAGTGGTTWNGKAAKMTIGAREDFTSKITTFTPAGRTLSWSSSANTIASVNSNGIVTAVNFSTGGDSNVSSAATGTATITVTATGATPNTDTFTVTTTMESQIDLMDLTPMKELFANHFLIGNITRGYNESLDYSGTGAGARISNRWLNRHFNVLTAENVMKPSYFFPSWQQGVGYNPTTDVITYYWNTADNFVNAAYNSNFKILAHVLLWHRQIPKWQEDLGDPAKKTEALTLMKRFITDVMTRYKGKIWAWDVLNEIFPDSVTVDSEWTTSMRDDSNRNNQEPNPWYMAIGSDFVYEAYLTAREADPDAILYYNDYNLDVPGKATMVRNMVRDVNNRYAQAYPSANRKLIEGIGMQSHHNTNVTVAHIRASLNLFKPLGVRISISELDLLSTGYNSALEGTDRPIHSSVTNTLKLAAANHYRDYFSLFIEFNDIIERVTFWGLYDRGSWRSGGAPLPFEGSPADSTNPTGILAKPAYYKILEALD